MSYIVRQRWDRKKRPERMIVEIDPSLWTMTKTERGKALTELRTSVRAFMDEIKTKAK